MALTITTAIENPWLSQIFDAEQAKQGGLVRRAISSVKEFSSEEELKAAVRRRGFHLIRTDNQYLILCNSGEVKLLL